MARKNLPTLVFVTITLLFPNMSQADRVDWGLIYPKFQVIDFNLPEQPLADSLIEFAIQSQMTVIVDHKLVKKYSSQRVSGQLKVIDCLRQLLATTDLEFTFKSQHNALVIIQKKHPTEITEPTQDTPRSGDQLEEVQITGTRYPFHYHSISHSHLHGNLTEFDYSRFFHSYSQNLILDQNPLSLTELAQNSSSIIPKEGLADSNDDFFIRGFPRHAIYYNGFRLNRNIGNKIPTALIKNVGILKGPSTLHYGQGEPGGVVNLSTRGTFNEPQNSIVFGGGNDHQKLHFDLSYPFYKGEQSIKASIIAGAERYDRLRNLNNSQRQFLHPSITLGLSNRTTLEWNHLKLMSNQEHDQGSVLFIPDGNALSLISVPGKPITYRPDFTADLDISQGRYDHIFDNTWRLSINYSYLSELREGVRGSESLITDTPVLVSSEDLNPQTYYFSIFENTFTRSIGTQIIQDQSVYDVASITSLWDESSTSESHFFSIKLEGSHDTKNLVHHFSTGLEGFVEDNQDFVSLIQRDDIQLLTLDDDGQTNIFDVVDIRYAEFSPEPSISTNTQQLSYTDQAFFIEDSIELNPKLILSLGTRLTHTHGKISSASTKNLQSYFEVSSQGGMVYKPTDQVSLYINYSEGMQPNYDIDDYSVSADKPELSEQVELGLKWIGFDGKLLATMAAYTIDKKNIAIVNYTAATRHLSINNSQRSSGIDIDYTLQANRRFNMIGNFSVNHSKITAGQLESLEPALVPSYSGSIFAHYTWPIKFGDLGLSGGAKYVGDRFGDTQNTKVLKNYHTVNLGSYIVFSLGVTKTRISLSIKNAFNAQYIETADEKLRISEGYGRRIEATVQMHF